MADATQQEQVTFEQGYEELKTIVSELDRSDVSVHDMFEGFRRGKGLETALREYLSAREGELTEIEEGKNLPRFEIVAPSSPSPSSVNQGTPMSQGIRVARDTPIGGGDADIPF